MADAKDKAAGVLKEIVAEIVGDGELAQEGNEQKRRPRPKEADNDTSGVVPLKRLRNLT